MVGLYTRFIDASRRVDEAAMRTCVDVDVFSITIPGHGRLVFDQFVSHIKRLIGIAQDYAGHMPAILKAVAEGETLVVRYSVRFSLDLGGLIEFTGIDMIEIRDGRIVSVYVAFDRAETLRQVSEQ